MRNILGKLFLLVFGLLLATYSQQANASPPDDGYRVEQSSYHPVEQTATESLSTFDKVSVNPEYTRMEASLHAPPEIGKPEVNREAIEIISTSIQTLSHQRLSTRADYDYLSRVESGKFYKAYKGLYNWHSSWDIRRY